MLIEIQSLKQSLIRPKWDVLSPPGNSEKKFGNCYYCVLYLSKFYIYSYIYMYIYIYQLISRHWPLFHTVRNSGSF